MRRKRYTKRKFTKIFLSVAAILLGLVIFGRVLQKLVLSSQYFKVQYVSLQEEAESVAVYNFAKDRALGRNIFRIDLKSLSKDIVKEFPNISKIVLIRRFPNKIEVNISLRKPVAKAYLSSGKIYYLDPNAILFSEASFPKQLNNLPTVKGLGDAPSKAELEKIVELIELFDKIDFAQNIDFKQIEIDSSGEMMLFTNYGFYIKIGNRDFERRLGMLKLLLDEASFALGELQYIDIRFKEPSLGYKKS